MKNVTALEVAMGIALVFLGWTGVHSGKIYNWGVSAPHPRVFGWALIALGVGIPLWLYCMRSRQNKDK